MAKFELKKSQQHDIIAAVMRKLEKHGLDFGDNSKIQPGIVDNEWVLTLQLIIPKEKEPIKAFVSVEQELQKFTVNSSLGRTIFLYIRGPKDAFLELLQQPRPAVPGSPHTPTPAGNPLPSSQRPLAGPQKINDYGHEDRH